MKLTWRKLAYRLGILAFSCSLSTLPVQALNDGDDAFGGHGLGGTWSVKVTLTNCPTGAAMGSPFSSYLSFAGNGTMTEETSNPGFAIGQRGIGLGVWSRSSWNTYSVKSVAFIFYTTAPAPPVSPGFTAGTQTITQTITLLNRDEWTANATIQFADATGTVYRNGCAVATAVRFQ
jgi:hypothetical protein